MTISYLKVIRYSQDQVPIQSYCIIILHKDFSLLLSKNVNSQLNYISTIVQDAINPCDNVLFIKINISMILECITFKFEILYVHVFLLQQA